MTLVLQEVQRSANLNKESLSRPLLSPPTAAPAEDLPLVFTFGSTKRCKVHSSPSSPSHKTSITSADREQTSLHAAAAVEVCFVQSPCGPCPASSSLCHHDPHENSHLLQIISALVFKASLNPACTLDSLEMPGLTCSGKFLHPGVSSGLQPHF